MCEQTVCGAAVGAAVVRGRFTLLSPPTETHDSTSSEEEGRTWPRSIMSFPHPLCRYQASLVPIPSCPLLSRGVTQTQPVSLPLSQLLSRSHRGDKSSSILHNVSDSSFVFVLSSAPQRLHPIISRSVSSAGCLSAPSISLHGVSLTSPP